MAMMVKIRLRFGSLVNFKNYWDMPDGKIFS